MQNETDIPFQTPWRHSEGSNPRVNAVNPSCRNIFETPSAVLRYIPMYALLCMRTCDSSKPFRGSEGGGCMVATTP
jgi:hypothetical protein